MNKIQMWIDNIIDRYDHLRKCPGECKGVSTWLPDKVITFPNDIEKVANALGLDVSRELDHAGDEKVYLFYRGYELRQWNFNVRGLENE